MVNNPYEKNFAKQPPAVALGRHVLLELQRCPPSILNDIQYLEQQLCQAVTEMGATLVNSNFHHFSPYGISGVVIIKESHLTIHTWPEHQYAAIDIFTCGDINLDAGVKHLANALKAEQSEYQLIRRGINIG
ncbi:MAG: adenosylmethionine decarboxylase [Chitinophagales bacterium]|nr:adenosylmethionine decarboxylase [Chitinophagales bacterium]